MTERVYKIALLGNEGVGKTGKKVSFTEFIFALKDSKKPKFKTVLLEIRTCPALFNKVFLFFAPHLESRFYWLLTNNRSVSDLLPARCIHLIVFLGVIFVSRYPCLIQKNQCVPLVEDLSSQQTSRMIWYCLIMRSHSLISRDMAAIDQRQKIIY